MHVTMSGVVAFTGPSGVVGDGIEAGRGAGGEVFAERVPPSAKSRLNDRVGVSTPCAAGSEFTASTLFFVRVFFFCTLKMPSAIRSAAPAFPACAHFLNWFPVFPQQLQISAAGLKDPSFRE